LPGCFQQGLRNFFPSEEYTGFKPSLLIVGGEETMTVNVMMVVHTTN
jgi:hypothetical protein